jgi:regulator of sigma E protease
MLAFSILSWLHSTGVVLVLAVGFGFVIFWHELGHFLAAKWVGIKVEQFAVGFGHAVVSWRKGIGFRLGNTQKEYRQRLDRYIEEKHRDEALLQEREGLDYQAAMLEAEKATGLGETEYRLNWIPLGGYVKMLGQDDLRPNAEAEDPRSYNRKSIGARMLVVSAGVVMNVILAGVGFTVLFMYGFSVAPAWVGSVTSNSPAANTVKIVNGQRVAAPLHVGDQIILFDGKPQEDFTKINLNVALSQAGVEIPIKVKHADGTVEDLLIKPEADPLNAGFLAIGIRQPQALRGFDPKDLDEAAKADLEKGLSLSLPEVSAVKPGESIVKINGADVNPNADDGDFWKLNRAFQDPNGKPVAVTVRDDKTGAERTTLVSPHFTMVFGMGEVDIAGMTPRPLIVNIQSGSTAEGKILPGDIVSSITIGSDTQSPGTEQFRGLLRQAGADNKQITLTVIRDGKTIRVPDLSPNMKIETAGKKSRGLGVQLGYDDAHPVLAAIQKDSPAAVAGIPAGTTLTAIGNQMVSNWFEVQNALASAKPGLPITIHYQTAEGEAQKQLTLSEEQRTQIAGLRHGNDLLLLKELIKVRKANGPVQAVSWGVTETRDFILQFYLTLRRIFGGSVGADNLMGPIGIFSNGAKLAFRGWDWLVWFLSMISANLAVVNFLPIPIVDGGLFTFLVLEKLQGRPLSPRTQAIAQYVGLAFLAGVFLFVTYHDILRII